MTTTTATRRHTMRRGQICRVVGMLSLLGGHMISGFVVPSSPQAASAKVARKTSGGKMAEPRGKVQAAAVLEAPSLNAPARRRTPVSEQQTLFIQSTLSKDSATVAKAAVRRTSSSSAPSLSPSSDGVTDTERSIQSTIRDLQIMAGALSVQRKLATQLGRQPKTSEWTNKLNIDRESLSMIIERGAKARLLLVKHFTPMVHQLVRKHTTGLSPSDLADLAGEGYLGVIQGALKYDKSKRCKFSTLVWFYIRKRVMMAAQEGTQQASRRSRSDDGQVQQLIEAQRYLKRVSEEPVTTEKVAHQLNVTVDRVHVLKRMARPIVSAENIYASETIADGSLPLFSCVVTESAKEEAIERCMSRLDPEERFVLAHRAGLVDGVAKSWQELQALMEGCGVSYLRKVEMRAKAHLMRDREFSQLLLDGSSPLSVISSV